MNATVSRITSRGYWKVIMYPSEFRRDRIANLLECQRLVENCKVSLRGWDYPHFERLVSSEDYICSGTDWEIYKEYWRLYRSGQFVHYFGCVEDWWRGSTLDAELGARYAPGEVLELIMVLYHMTEVHEFASRMAQRSVFGEQMSLTIEAHGMRGRRLIRVGNSLFDEFGQYVSQQESFKFESAYAVQDLIGRSAEVALDQALRVYELFNWRNARMAQNVSGLRDEQRKLLERRL
jgi:hypothetical protein